MMGSKPSKSDGVAVRVATLDTEGGASTRIEPQDDASAARDSALRLLGRREHSADELRRKLKKRGYPIATIAVVVASLDDAHSVSDVRFAESFVRVRSERGQGPLKIRAELRERGVADGIIDEVMMATAEFWLERAQRARVKRFGSVPPTDRDAWNRQARFLAQRGYPADLIYRTLGAVRA